VIDRCHFRGELPTFSEEGLDYALGNLLAVTKTTWAAAAINVHGDQNAPRTL